MKTLTKYTRKEHRRKKNQNKRWRNAIKKNREEDGSQDLTASKEEEPKSPSERTVQTGHLVLADESKQQEEKSPAQVEESKDIEAPEESKDPEVEEESNFEDRLSEQNLRKMQEQQKGYGAVETGQKSAEQRVEFTVYLSRQYQILLTASLVIFANSLSFLTYSVPNTSCTEVFYQVQGSAVGQDFVVVSLLMYNIGTLFSNNQGYYRGPLRCLTVGGFMTTLGYFIRFLSLYFPATGYQRYNCIFFAQIILGLAQPMLLNSIVKLSNVWFSVSERDWATKFMFMAYPVGAVAGLIFAYNSSKLQCGSGHDFQFVYIIQLVLSALAWISTFWCLEKPPTPPSFSASLSESQRDSTLRTRSTMVSEFRKLLRNRDFCWLVLSFMVSFGFSIAMLAAPAVSKVAEDYGYSSKDIVVFSLAYLTGGLVGAFLFGLAVAPHSYHSARKVGFILMVFAMIFFDIWWHDKLSSRKSFPEAAYFVFGLVVLPLTPLCLETAAEITYDTPEEFSSGTLFSFGSIGAIAMYTLLSSEKRLADNGHLLPKYAIYHSLLAVLGCIFACMTYGLYRRTWAESSSSERDSKKDTLPDI